MESKEPVYQGTSGLTFAKSGRKKMINEKNSFMDITIFKKRIFLNIDLLLRFYLHLAKEIKMEISRVFKHVFYQGPLKVFSIVLNQDKELKSMGHFRRDVLERVYAVSVRIICTVLSAALMPLIILGLAYKGYKLQLLKG